MVTSIHSLRLNAGSGAFLPNAWRKWGTTWESPWKENLVWPWRPPFAVPSYQRQCATLCCRAMWWKEPLCVTGITKKRGLARLRVDSGQVLVAHL